MGMVVAYSGQCLGADLSPWDGLGRAALSFGDPSLEFRGPFRMQRQLDIVRNKVPQGVDQSRLIHCGELARVVEYGVEIHEDRNSELARHSGRPDICEGCTNVRASVAEASPQTSGIQNASRRTILQDFAVKRW